MRPLPPQPPGIVRARQRLAAASGDLDLSALGLNDGELASLIDEPDALGRLRKVRTLDLSDNDLDTLPSWLGELEALEELIVRRTRLTVLPPELGRAARLTTLDLTANQLVDLPGELEALRLLHTLELRANRLTTVPPVVLRLTGLRELGLSDNGIRELPAVLNEVDLRTDGNPIGEPEPVRIPPPDWADPAGAVTVHAVYFQYYAYDPEDPQLGDWPTLQDSVGDGLLAPSASAIRVVSAVHSGDVHLHVRVASSFPEPAGVAAATDLWLPSGVLWVTGWEGGPMWQHDFGGPVRVRLLLEVTGRDELEEFEGPSEVQRMTVVVVDRERPRWRSVMTDRIGESLRDVRDTARAWDPGQEP